MSPTLEKEKEELVIVGNGMVSHRFCDLITQGSGKDKFNVSVYGEEPYYAYDRVHLSDHFYGKSFRQLQLSDQDWYTERNILVNLYDPITHVDIRAKTITSKSGNKKKYDKLVFATGSNPFTPPIEGVNEIKEIFYYRNFSDLVKIRNAAASAKRAVVIGGGLLGLEAAKALTELKVKTHVIEFSHHLMPRQIDEGASNKLKEAMEAMNISLHCRRQTESITYREGEILVHFKDGDHIVTNMVIIAAGIVPRDDLARKANLKCDPRGGIVVDDQLMTSIPDTYAIGECAHHKGRVYGLVSPGYKMAEELSKHLKNAFARFKEMDLSTRLKLLGVEVISIGQPFQPGKIYIYEEKDLYRRITIHEGKIIGVIAVGEWFDLPELQKRIDLAESISKSELKTYRKTGNIGAINVGEAGVLHWPNNMIVCNCMNVNKGQLMLACQQACKTVEDISQQTGAGTVCGTCKPQLAQFVGMEESFDVQEKGHKLLGFSFVFSLIVLLIFIFSPSLSYSNSVQDTIYQTIETLWRDSFYKQVTGFALLGLTFLSMSLSLRKRFKNFNWGDYQYWRSAHILFITSVFIFLPLHSGMRMGDNINLALMLSYLISAFTGTATSWVVWQESAKNPKLQRFARKHRQKLVWLHLVCLWPLPTLLTFHVLKFYYY